MPHIQHTISSSGGGAPSGAAGGDLSGTYPNPGVAQLNGVAASAYATLANAQTITGSKLFTAGFRYDQQAVSGTATLVDVTQPLVVVDTTSAAFTITLPAAPSSGSIFIFVDKLGTWATNNLTLARNGKNIDGAAANKVLATANGIVALQYNGTDWRTIWDLLSSANPVMDGTAAAGTSQDAARADHVHPSDTSRAPLASPTFTGTVTLPHNGTVAVSDLASGIPQSLSSSGSSTKAVADTTAHVIGGAPFWNGTGWLGLGLPDYYRNGANANISETVPRQSGVGAVAVVIGATGIMSSAAVVLYAGQVITNITFRTGSTAASGPTHWWVALYDTQATPALIAQSADQTSTALNASTNTTIALGSPAPYTVTTTGIHYICLMVATSTTQPTLMGNNTPGATVTAAIVSGQKVLYQSSGSALTTTAPGTITSGTALAGIPYMATS